MEDSLCKARPSEDAQMRQGGRVGKVEGQVEGQVEGHVEGNVEW